MSEPVAVVRLPIGDEAPHWRTFTSPVHRARTHHLAEVRSLVERAEAWSAAGHWVVGALSYEAAPAFDSAMQVPAAGAQPLAWFAAFSHASEGRPAPAPGFAVGEWAGADPVAHRAAVARIVERIAAGDTYQVNYTQRLRATFQGDPRALFDALVSAQPTAYSAYLNLGRFAVCSASPELFVRRSGSRVLTRPMKGTAARGSDPDSDRLAAQALRSSAKEVAENVMIVDLLRNDLSRISRTGTVMVEDLCAVETHPTLHTMTSTVSGQLQPEATLVDLLDATFPCGSVTGAPKISTMTLIDELEPGPRGIYCGAIGLMAPGGDATFSVPIRTAIVDTQEAQVEYGVGGGITFSSDPDAEFAELQTKARVLESLARGPRS